MLKFCNTNKTFGKKIKNTLWNMGCLKNDRSIVFWQLLSKMIFKNDHSIVFWQLLSKMIFKNDRSIVFWQLLSKMIVKKKGVNKFLVLKKRHHQQLLVFVVGLARFSTICHFTIFDYIICKNSWVPAITKCNYLLFIRIIT